MKHLDELFAAAENPPFSRAARLYVDILSALDGPALLTLSVTSFGGNSKQESDKKRLERIVVGDRKDLQRRVEWLLDTTAKRRLLPPKIDETYEARPLGFDGPLRVFGTDLDCRLDTAK